MLFDSGGKHSSERLCNLPKVTKLLNSMSTLFHNLGSHLFNLLPLISHSVRHKVGCSQIALCTWQGESHGQDYLFTLSTCLAEVVLSKDLLVGWLAGWLAE